MVVYLDKFEYICFLICEFGRIMQDTDNIAITETSETIDVLSLATDWYPILLSSCSVRAQNVLSAYQAGFSSSSDFFTALLNISPQQAGELRNCGRKSVKEIMSLSQALARNIGYTTEPAQEVPKVTLPDNIDKILPLIFDKTNNLSVRAKNAVYLFVQDCSRSVHQLYSVISAPSFSAFQLKNIGRKTAEEVGAFLDDIKNFIEQFKESTVIDSLIEDLSAPRLTSIKIPAGHQDNLWALKDQLGYFPLFATISTYLDSLDDETKTIIAGCVRIHNGQTIIDRKEVAEQLGISSERVRQKRNVIIENLAAYFSGIRKAGFVSENSYSYIMTHTEDYVNSTEGTDFTPNFVRWVLGSTFNEITIVGDIIKSLTSFYNDDLFINIVPSELCIYFDFSSYVAALDEKLAEKRTDEERVNLKSFMLPFFKVKYYEDQEKDIETACRSILYLTYELEVDMGQLIFKPNKRKNNPDIIEDILRAAGHPMTLDELYDEFTFQYPERSAVYESFRGNISNNPNIIPLSRTSTYALAEWQNGDYRGGTIREFVSEYLDSLPSHIATVEATGDYVRQFRPTSSNESIVSNLSQDKTQKYAIYTRDDQRYIGYRDYTYDLSFVLFDPERVAKRPTEESMRLLLSFINEHKHFPLSQPNDPEETRLYRFVDNMRSLYNRGKMDDATAVMWSKFYDELGVYKLSRKEVEELDFISLEIRKHLNSIEWPYDFRSIDDIVGQALDYYVVMLNEECKNEVFRQYFDCVSINGKTLGHYFIENIIDRYVFNTKRSSNWDGKEWITEDVLKLFDYDDEAIEKMLEEMVKQRQLIENLKHVQNNLG